MRENREQERERHEAVESSLGHCLLDSDAESMRQARSTRWRSMLLSSGIQAALLTAAVVLPLFASQALPLLINDPPIPVPKGIPLVKVPPASGDRASNAQRNQTPPKIRLDQFQPPRIPPNTVQIDDRASRPALGNQVAGDEHIGLPWGTENAPPILSQYERRTAPPPPVETNRARGPVAVSKGAQEAKLIHKVQPRYPPLALQIRLEGNVELRAVIASDGTVRDLQVVSGHPMFIESTLEAVQQWRYQPTLLSGEPVDVQTYITVIFRISR